MSTINLEIPGYKLQELGFSALSDAENISLIIGGHNIEKCRSILASIDYNLRELAKLSTRDLQELGLTQRETSALAGALELGRRKNLAEALERPQIKCSKDVADIMQPLIADLQHEEFHVLFMNRSNKVTGKMKLSQGGISGTVTDVRLVMKRAIQAGASGIIVAHNHPSGNLNPSESDTKITCKIKEAGTLLDIQLLDHIIIAEKDYYSFADNGLI
ncbi:MAG: JAB domain-containing protein [Candidatus Omnitrophica bacterium]|nr:JAB domain-containing protein [Candidatus Omnitrophota bacterium]